MLFRSDEDVLGNVEVREQQWFLVDRGDAMALRLRSAADAEVAAQRIVADVAALTRREVQLVIHDFDPESDAYTEKNGRKLPVDITFAEVDPSEYVALVIPGGVALRGCPACWTVGLLETISAGRVRLRAGTLYATLHRLAAERLVEVDREEIVDGRLRRYYRLTPQGGQRLEAEVDRMRRNTAVAARRLGLLGGTP